MKRIKWTIFITLAFGLLAGCAQAFPTVVSSELPTSVPTAVPTAAEQVVEVPDAETAEEAMEVPAEEAQPTAEISQPQPTEATSDGVTSGEVTPSEVVEPTTAQPTESPTGTTPLGSPDLKASNPANVNLASGKVQLVEFFAFW